MKNKKRIVIILSVLIGIFIISKIIDRVNYVKALKWGHFEKIADMNVARAGHKLFMLKDGRVLIFGGDGSFSQFEDEVKTPNTAEIFDPKTNKFTVLKNFKEPRLKYSAVMLDDGRILIAGGNLAKKRKRPSLQGAEVLKSSLIYDPIKDKVTKGSDMNFARDNHSSIKLKDGRILIFGGFSGNIGKNWYEKKAEIYAPKLNKFALLKTAPNFIYDNPANTCLLSDGRVFIVNYLRENDKAEIFDPKTNEFKILNVSLASGLDKFYHYLHGIILLKNDKIVLFENDKDGFNNVKILDLKTNKITNVGHMKLKDRKGYNATLLSDENILITGGSVGEAGTHRLVNSAELFDTKSLKFYNLPKMSYKKQAPKTILLDNGSIFINGGFPDFNGTRAITSEIFIPNNNN